MNKFGQQLKIKELPLLIQPKCLKLHGKREMILPKKNIRKSFASAQLTTTQKKYVSEKQILRTVAGLFRTLVVVFVLPKGKQHSRSNLRKGETHEDYGNHHRKATDM